MNISVEHQIPFSSPPAEWLRIFIIILFVLITIIGVIGNGFVLICILSKDMKTRRSPTNLLLMNMSCADLLLLIFNVFDIVQLARDSSWPTRWMLGEALCKIVRFSQVVGCYVSVQTLFVISVERYIAILHPIKISDISQRTRLLSTFIVIWTIGIIAALPNLYLLQLVTSDVTDASVKICGLSSKIIHLKLVIAYKYFESIMFYFIPILFQTILYFIICRNIFLVNRAMLAKRRQLSASSNIQLRNCSSTKLTSLPSRLTDNSIPSSRRLRNENRCHYQLTLNKSGKKFYQVTTIPTSGVTVQQRSAATISADADMARKKAIIMLLCIAILYFICFSPQQINFIYTTIKQHHLLFNNRVFFVITMLFALLSTAINPIFYYIFSKYFHRRFNLIFRSLCPLKFTTTFHKQYPF